MIGCDNKVLIVLLNDDNKLKIAVDQVIKIFENKNSAPKNTNQDANASTVVNQQQLNRAKSVINKRKSSKDSLSSKISTIQTDMKNAINNENVSETYITGNPSFGGKSGL